MREAGVDDEACQSMGAAAVDVEAPPAEDVTTSVSVATMRRLAARSAKDRRERPTDPPDRVTARPPPSVPSFFGKSGAVLVIPEGKSRAIPRVIPEPESEPRRSHSETSGTTATTVSRVTRARSAFRPKALALLSDAERLRRTKRRSTRSFLGRLLVVATYALLVFVVTGELWVRNVGGVRERVAAGAPAVKALLERGTALLFE